MILVDTSAWIEFLRDTGSDVCVAVDRLPPGRQCAESDDDVRALAVFIEAIEQAQASLEAAQADYDAVVNRPAYDETTSARVSLEQAQAAVDSFTGTDLAAFAEAVSAAGIGLFGNSKEP